MFNKMIKNDEAVSPIVATLVLIVVAIIGAAAVGLLMGSFSSNVSDDMNTGDTRDAASAELITAGSTSVFPVSEVLAREYMDAHSGVKVTVMAGGSGAGVVAAANGACDIGASSAALTATQKSTYPNLREVEIGGSAVVVVTNNIAPLNTITGATPAGLYAAYTADTDSDGIVKLTDAGVVGILEAGEFADDDGTNDVTIYQRSEESGTEETFAKYISAGAISSLSKGVGATGNSGMVAAVKATGAARLGFIDYGFLKDSGLTAMTIGATSAAADQKAVGTDGANIIATLKGQTGGYPSGAVKHLFYITNGEPSTLEQSFIDFARSTEAINYFTEAGVFSVYKYTS